MRFVHPNVYIYFRGQSLSKYSSEPLWCLDNRNWWDNENQCEKHLYLHSAVVVPTIVKTLVKQETLLYTESMSSNMLK